MFYLTSKFHGNSVNTFEFIERGLLEPPSPSLQGQELRKSPGGIGLNILWSFPQCKNIRLVFMSSDCTHVQWMTYCEGAICHSLTRSLTHSLTHSLAHSLTRSLTRFTQIWGKNSIYGHKNINACVIKKNSPCSCEAVNTEEVFYMFSLRYRILSLKIDSLPSNLHTKRIHSNGKSIYSKTYRPIEGPFCDTLPFCKELTIVREFFVRMYLYTYL